jgi:hypothetical protein
MAASVCAAEPPVPLFEYRVLQSAFRKSPTNTDAVVAETLRNILPEDIRPFAAVSLSLSVAGWNYRDGDTPLEFCKRFDRQGVKFFVEIADPGIPDPPNHRRWFTAAELREIFAACTNCAGADTGETFWAFTGKDNPKISTWLLDVLRACADNRRLFILGEGTWNTGHWTKFLFQQRDELRTNGLGRWLVPMHKNTKPWATFQNVGILQGAWMSGLVENYGMWNDQWNWTYSSFGNAGEFPPYNKKDENVRKIPYTFFLRQWLWAISQGAAINATEDPMCFSREGKANSTFTKYLHPFIKGVGEHRIVPSKAAVLAKTRAMIDPFGTYETPAGQWSYDPKIFFPTYLDAPVKFAPKSYDPFTVLFRNTYGFTPAYEGTNAAGRMFPREPALPDRLTRETMPNTARCYAVPILTHPDERAPAGMKTLRLAELRTDAAIQAAYATMNADDNEAYAVEVDDSLFVLNGNENLDRDQRFKLPLGGDVLLAMEDALPFQNIIFGKREGRDKFWFQTNGYHGDGKTSGQRYACTPKPTVITFTAAREPKVSVEGPASRLTIAKPWDAASRTLTLSFDHADGAVNFTISSD